MIEKTKQKYVKPAMQVYELKEPARLLQSSKEQYEPVLWPE